MDRTQSKKRLIVIIAVLAAAVLVVGAVALAFSLKSASNTKPTDTNQATDVKKDTAVTETDSSNSTTATKPVTPTVDPATLSSIAIDPMNITVSYTKGIPGFDFAVKRTADRTEYVEFSAAALVGTKCTDDQGSFASIIKNPSTDESQTTIAQKVTIGSDTYGLSLYGKGCTNNIELFDQYQAGFSNGFSNLKAI